MIQVKKIAPFVCEAFDPDDNSLGFINDLELNDLRIQIIKEEVPMIFKLDSNTQINKHCKDGKDRSYLQYYLNDVKILQQKLPFNENLENGYNHRTSIYNEYILNGKMYQTRYDIDSKKERHVSYPLSKIKLKELGVPNNFKIVCNSNFF